LTATQYSIEYHTAQHPKPHPHLPFITIFYVQFDERQNGDGKLNLPFGYGFENHIYSYRKPQI
jgi:hypothetical protein